MVLKKKTQFPYVSSLEFQLSCEYISHTSFQSPHLLSFSYHTRDFSPETELGAEDPGNGFRAILDVAHFLSLSSYSPGPGSNVDRRIISAEKNHA